jgi:amino acid permease
MPLSVIYSLHVALLSSTSKKLSTKSLCLPYLSTYLFVTGSVQSWLFATQGPLLCSSSMPSSKEADPISAEEAMATHIEAVGSNFEAKEDVTGIVDLSERAEMKQELKSRHIQMIALAGAIGTGLFLGSGRAIAHSGPLGTLLSYSMTGMLAAGVVFTMAEMAALVPISGGIVRYAQLFVDPSLSFANGWNLVYKGLIFIPTEIVAASVLMQFWLDVNSAVVRSSLYYVPKTS